MTAQGVYRDFSSSVLFHTAVERIRHIQDSGLGVRVKLVQTFQAFPTLLKSERGLRGGFSYLTHRDSVSMSLGTAPYPYGPPIARACDSLYFSTAVQGRALSTETKVESGTSQSNSGTSIDLSNSGLSTHGLFPKSPRSPRGGFDVQKLLLLRVPTGAPFS